MEDQRSHNSNAATILVDTDVLVAGVKDDDAHHSRVKDIFHALERRPVIFLTSNYVFSEALTVVSQRINHETAITLGKTIQSPQSPFQMKWITEELAERAFKIFMQQTSKNVSFVDCTNMALLDYFKMDYIFSFDQAYITNGYRLAEDLTAG